VSNVSCGRSNVMLSNDRHVSGHTGLEIDVLHFTYVLWSPSKYRHCEMKFSSMFHGSP
jgi:hypothetical protein